MSVGSSSISSSLAWIEDVTVKVLLHILFSTYILLLSRLALLVTCVHLAWLYPGITIGELVLDLAVNIIS